MSALLLLMRAHDKQEVYMEAADAMNMHICADLAIIH